MMTTIESKKLNIPLPREMHEALFAESRQMGVPAARLVRSLLAEWLRERRRERRREDVRRFATRHAGSAADLDPDLEAAASEELRHLETRDETG